MVKKRSRSADGNKFRKSDGPAQDESKAMKGESDSEGEEEIATEPTSSRGKMSVFEAHAGGGRGKVSTDSTGKVFRNKQRVLMIASRGIVHRFRHLFLDIQKLLPHSTKDAKLEGKDRPSVINEICEMRGCNSALYFETRKHKDLFIWVAKTPLGPSAKFLVQNIHTMGELKFTGNHLLGSRPFLVFDATFESEPYLMLLKEMFMQVFGTPRGHRRSKPFVDHTMSFYFLDGRIWVRNYQVTKTESGETALVEVGPRFCLLLHRIFAGAFQGATIFSNASYVSPNTIRSQEKLARSVKYSARKEVQKKSNFRHQTLPKVQDPFAKVFK